MYTRRWLSLLGVNWSPHSNCKHSKSFNVCECQNARVRDFHRKKNIALNYHSQGASHILIETNRMEVKALMDLPGSHWIRLDLNIFTSALFRSRFSIPSRHIQCNELFRDPDLRHILSRPYFNDICNRNHFVCDQCTRKMNQSPLWTIPIRNTFPLEIR